MRAHVALTWENSPQKGALIVEHPLYHVCEDPNVLQENVGACLEALVNNEQVVSRQLEGKDEYPGLCMNRLTAQISSPGYMGFSFNRRTQM